MIPPDPNLPAALTGAAGTPADLPAFYAPGQDPALDVVGDPYDSSYLEDLESNPPLPEGHISSTEFVPNRFSNRRAALPMESQLRHADWALRRRQTFDAMQRTHQSDRRVESFATCGGAVFVHIRPGTDAMRLTCSCCRDRLCDPCGRRRAVIIRKALEERMAPRTVRFVTLTLRASATPLRDQFDRLYRCFSTMRRRAWWKAHVTGGAAFCEVKLGKNSGMWHCHLHLLVNGCFMAQSELSAEWHAVTGDSYIVDVRACNDDAAKARYVTKYVTKPADPSLFSSTKHLDEFIGAIKGRRLCTTFGEWRGTELEPDAPAEDGWQSLGSLATLAARASAGCPQSIAYLATACGRWPGLVDALALHGIDPREHDPGA